MRAEGRRISRTPAGTRKRHGLGQRAIVGARAAAIAFAWTAGLLLSGCDEPSNPGPKPAPSPQGTPTAQAHGHGHEHEHAHEHEHVAPHGGTLVVLGDEFAHVELVLDPAVGSLTAYVLDGHAEKAIRLRRPRVSLILDAVGVGDAQPAKLPKPLELALLAVANPLTGETAEDSSQYAGGADQLKGVKRFTARLPELTVRGREFKDIAFKFPEGNERDHAEHAPSGPQQKPATPPTQPPAQLKPAPATPSASPQTTPKAAPSATPKAPAAPPADSE